MDPAEAKRNRRRRVHKTRIEDPLLLGLCHGFLAGRSADQLADWLREQDETLDVGRTRVYDLLREAHERGLFRLQATDVGALGRELAAAVGRDPERIVVVGARGEHAVEHVALRGAQVAFELIQELAERRTHAGEAEELVRVGLGGGQTLRRLSEELAKLLRLEAGGPRLGVHALSSGFDPLATQHAPITFLGNFGDVARQLVGLFSSGVLEESEFEHMRTLPGVAESFSLATKIDLVVTSLASARDRTGALNTFLDHAEDKRLRASRKELHQRGWIGDVLYEPYGPDGPIEANLPVRTVSVFTLPELAALAHEPERRVLLVVAPSESGYCKADALVPLLTHDQLDLWTHLVLDVRTAEQAMELLVAGGDSGPAAPRTAL